MANDAQLGGPVRAPDTFGGWASTHVIVCVVPGVEVGRLPDGRLGLIAGNGMCGMVAAETEAALLMNGGYGT